MEWRELLLEGEEDGEDGALVRTAAYGEAAAVAVDDVLGDPEAEAGAGEFTGGEERLEDAAGSIGGHAVTSVGEDEADAAA